MVTGLEHVDVPNNRSNTVLVTTTSLQVGGQVGGMPEGTHLRGICDEVRIAHAGLLVVFSRIRGDDLNIHITQRDVGVVVLDVLHDRGSVRTLSPSRGRHHVVVDPLVVPQAGLIRDPRIGILGAENDLRTELLDDLIRVVDVVGVGVRSQVEREVRGGDAMVRHVAKHPVRIAESSIFNSLSQRVTRILAIRSPNTLRAVDHGEDAARLEQDGIRRTRRREDMNAGGAVRAGEGVDLRVDAVHAFFLGRGRGLIGGIRGFGGIGRISTVRGCTVRGSNRGTNPTV